MGLKSPLEIFEEWLDQLPQETRVAVAVDSDRFLADASVLSKSVIVGPDGRKWQLVVFRGDDVSFRLAFRAVAGRSRTIIVLSRGTDISEPVDVSWISDVLAQSEVSEPLDLSVTAVFRRVAPKINFPPAELRRFKADLLSRVNDVEAAVEKLIQKWGKPDSWGRGQVAGMVLLAYHPELGLADVWPDETGIPQFLAHVVRLLVCMPQLRDQRDVVRQIVAEAARAQVRDHVFWAASEPEELAAFLVLRDFCAKQKLQNPSTQLAGLLIFSPDFPLVKMEPTVMAVTTLLRKTKRAWAMVNEVAEGYLTPKRAIRVLELLPAAAGSPLGVEALVSLESPSLLLQQLRQHVAAYLVNPGMEALSSLTGLESHKVLEEASVTSARTQQCRAGLRLVLRFHEMERRLSGAVPAFPHADAVLDLFVSAGHFLQELDLSRSHHDLQTFAEGNDELLDRGIDYLFGGGDETRPTPESLKGRVLARLRAMEEALADFVRADPWKFGRGHRSARGFLRDSLDASAIREGSHPGRAWVLIFDGMRYDTWHAVVKPILAEFFEIQDRPFFCVLPSYTAFARTGLLAGALPTEWKGFKGMFTDDEQQLFAVGIGLSSHEVKTKVRFVTEADTTKARAMLNFSEKEATPFNVLIYPVSDHQCHDFKGDLSSFNDKIRADVVGNKTDGVRGILDDLLKRIAPQDVVLLSSDHGFVELLPGDAVPVEKTEADRAKTTVEAAVRWRYVDGFAPDRMPDAVPLKFAARRLWMATARRWFMREGSKDRPRYTHGGLSLPEVVVPGAVLRRVTEKEARIEWLELPSNILVDEDSVYDLPVPIRNNGNCEAEYEVLVFNNLGEELLSRKGRLAPAATKTETARVVAKYKETSDREPDLKNTVTGVSLRLRHTDVKGAWRDALDGSISIPVKVKPKPVKLETDALKGFDDV